MEVFFCRVEDLVHFYPLRRERGHMRLGLGRRGAGEL